MALYSLTAFTGKLSALANANSDLKAQISMIALSSDFHFRIYPATAKGLARLGYCYHVRSRQL